MQSWTDSKVKLIPNMWRLQTYTLKTCTTCVLNHPKCVKHIFKTMMETGSNMQMPQRWKCSQRSSLLPLDVAPWRFHMSCLYLAPCRRGSTPQQGWRGTGSALRDSWSHHTPPVLQHTDKSHRASETRRPARTWSAPGTHTGPAYLKQHRHRGISQSKTGRHEGGKRCMNQSQNHFIPK